VTRFILALCAALLAWICARAALAEPRSTDEISRAIRQIQPRATADRADRLAEIIQRQARSHELPEWALWGTLARESAFMLSVERGTRRGPLGEIGLAQIHPSMLALAMPPGCSRRLEGAECQIGAGAQWLALARERCPGPWPRWVAAYSMSRCPDPRRAPSMRQVRRLVELITVVGWEGDLEVER